MERTPIVHMTTASVSPFPTTNILQDVLRFPVWWYTRGARRFARVFFAPVRFLAVYLSLPVLAANLAQPLFGDISWSGRLVSLLVRLGHFLVLGSALGLLGVVLGALYLFWMLLPVLAVVHVVRVLAALLFFWI